MRNQREKSRMCEDIESIGIKKKRVLVEPEDLHQVVHELEGFTISELLD